MTINTYICHMRLKQLLLKHTELFILIVLWLIVFINPVIVESGNENYDWGSVLDIWGRMLPFLILTIINHFVLLPYLFFKGQKKAYFALALIVLIAFSFLLSTIKNPEPEGRRRPGVEHRPERPPHEFGPPPRFEDHQRQQGHQDGPRPGGLPARLNSLLIAFLILGFDTGFRIAFRWSKSEKIRSDLEKQQLKTELDFLKHQISPHFFMNTLNNIHALVDIDSEDAKKAIIRLSRMMRYLLYESENGMTTLRKEIEFTQSFLDLMRIRYPEERVKISEDYPSIESDIIIPAFLFVSYIENAFKHGINPRGESFINLKFNVVEKHLQFHISNSNFPIQEPEEIKSSGVGLVNSRQRLELLFQGKYELEELSEDKAYTVNLKIPINAT